MNVTIPIYQDRRGESLRWTTLGLGRHTRTARGRNALKLERRLVGALRAALAELDPAALQAFSLCPGTRLERVRLELTLRGEQGKRTFTGRFPLILEPRWFNRRERLLVVYHPARQGE